MNLEGNMQIIEQMLTGQLPMPEFTQALQKDQALRDTIRHFVPEEAKNDPHHCACTITL